MPRIGAVEENVLPSRELRVEASADLEQARRRVRAITRAPWSAR